MNVKSLLTRPFAAYIHRQVVKSRETALADQEALLSELVEKAKQTQFGKDHEFAAIKSYDDFKTRVPLRDYEELKPYIEKIKEGAHNVLWKGRPLYFAKTSGTTSGAKYIPITKASVDNHFNSARNAVMCYMSETGNFGAAAGKLIFLSGSPELERVGDIPTGRLSGISNHLIPRYVRTNQMPSYETNCIEDWEQKLDKIVEETIQQNMTLISGIPPWMQMYFDRLTERSGKAVGELFPNLKLLVQGGVNFEPYKNRLLESVGRPVDVVEVFPASEGFFAFQDSQTEEGLLLNSNSGIFFEFVPLDEYGKPNATRLRLHDVQLGVKYALIINSNAGLWGYSIGDTVRFVSLKPYRLVVSGRVKHYISAFGEHVIGEEVEKAMLHALQQVPARVTEFSVAPMVAEAGGKSYHEWFIEFEKTPDDMEAFRMALDGALRKQNVYYDDLVSGNILAPLQVTTVNKNGFIDYMKSIGKLGGQNKAPRLTNDRQLAKGLQPFLSSAALV